MSDKKKRSNPWASKSKTGVHTSLDDDLLQVIEDVKLRYNIESNAKALEHIVREHPLLDAASKHETQIDKKDSNGKKR